MSVLDFFAGSGLVRLGLEAFFKTVWANDNSPKKGDVYRANSQGGEFVLADIRDVKGAELPSADMAWASFPCQDLSLAGNLGGISSGTRSGLFWEWIRVLDELAEAGRRPPLLVAENVVGFLISSKGSNFRAAYGALRERGYRAGAVVVDARLFLPQSRPRAFLIACAEEIPLAGLNQEARSLPFHTRAVASAAEAVDNLGWVWWKMSEPSEPVQTFSAICDRRVPGEPVRGELNRMLSDASRERLNLAKGTGAFLAGTGYRRARPNEQGVLRQRLEVRFDGIAGCLRTPEGGSSRQIVLMVRRGQISSRLITLRECLRLMGAPDDYVLPGSYNDGYRAIGDAVAVPVTRWIAEQLLAPLAARGRAALKAVS